jgi:hypothetical protein
MGDVGPSSGLNSWLSKINLHANAWRPARVVLNRIGYQGLLTGEQFLLTSC